MQQESLRVCLLSSHYPPRGTEGVARLTHLMARGLSNLGHEVHVVTSGKLDRTTFYDGAYVHEVRPTQRRYQHYENVGYYNFGWSLNYSHTVYERIQSLILNHRIQLVDSPLWLLEGLVTAVAQELPVIVRLVTSMRQLITLEKGILITPEVRLFGDLEAQFLSLSQGLIPISQAIKQTCSQIYKLDMANHPYQVIHAGLDPLPDTAVHPLIAQAKRDPIVLFVGRLEKRKGILDLFEAIPKVLDQFPQAQFWFAGKDNSEGDGFIENQQLTYPDYFQKKYRAYADRVQFLGYVADSKLELLYQICDLFVAPSLYESFGLIFLEAMNHARPVIGCQVGGPTEIITDGETGLLVPPQSSDVLAEAIITLLGDPSRRREMGLAGRQRLMDQFSYLKMAEHYAAFYRQLLS
jgi:glycosyltransferase involved in cell wall biosynthesis